MADTKIQSPEVAPEALDGQTISYSRSSDQIEQALAWLQEKVGSSDGHFKKNREALTKVVGDLGLLADYLNSLLSHLSQAIIFIDIKGNVITYNMKAEKLFGVPKEQVLFKPFWMNFTDKVLGFSLREALKNSSSYGPESVTVQSEKEGQRELLVEAFSIRNKNGRKEDPYHPIEGIIVLIRDVTEDRRSESKSSRADRINELGEMAGMIAHEIRNPLGGIKGFASLLERDLQDRPDLKKMAGYIIQGADTVNDIVTRVLNFSRPVTVFFEKIDLISFVKDIRTQVLTEESHFKNSEIKVESSEDALEVALDIQSIRTCLKNLTINALQAMHEGGTVTIALVDGDQDVTIRISDTGTGIPEENLKKIFSPFFTTKPDCLGFGLSEVHKIIHAHDGKIEVTSKEGKGTTVSLILPKSHRS